MQNYTKEAQKSFLPTFESNFFDIEEELTNDISTCLTTATEGGTTVYRAKNAQGKLALSLVNKNKTTVLLQLMGPLQSLENLIPAQVDFSIRLLFSNGKVFTNH